MVGCRGPFRAGEQRSAQDCAWFVEGEEELDYAHVAVVGDFDGDGVSDLAVALPRNGNFSDVGGKVLLFRGPLPPGTYGPADADLIVRSAGAATGDWFGFVLRRGDLDGNGADDLVVHAMGDLDDEGHPAGSIQLLFGGPDLFP